MSTPVHLESISVEAAAAIAQAVVVELEPYLSLIASFGYVNTTFWVPAVLVVGCLWWFFRQFLSTYR